MALGAKRGDFEKFSGDDLDLVVTVVDEDEAVQPISGATSVRWQLGRLAAGTFPAPRNPGQPLVAYSLGSGIELVSGGVSGQLVISIDGNDTADLRGGDYYHEVELVFGGKVTTVLYGVATLRTDQVV